MKNDQEEPRRRFTCPICKRPLSLPKEGVEKLPKYFPFCSERCKLIDLGAWFDADYRIPAKPDEETEDSLGEGPATPPEDIER